jgi:hypothetical protein
MNPRRHSESWGTRFTTKENPCRFSFLEQPSAPRRAARGGNQEPIGRIANVLIYQKVLAVRTPDWVCGRMKISSDTSSRPSTGGRYKRLPNAASRKGGCKAVAYLKRDPFPIWGDVWGNASWRKADDLAANCRDHADPASILRAMKNDSSAVGRERRLAGIGIFVSKLDGATAWRQLLYPDVQVAAVGAVGGICHQLAVRRNGRIDR